MNNASMKSFNSLQTGKWILTLIDGDIEIITGFVSIPFKRENGS